MTRAFSLESSWWLRLCTLAMGLFLAPLAVFAAADFRNDKCNVNLVIEKYVEANISNTMMVTTSKEWYESEGATYGSTPLVVRGNTPMTIIYPGSITLTSIKDAAHDISVQVVMIINGVRITPLPGALTQSININNPGESTAQNEIMVTLGVENTTRSPAVDTAGTYTGNFSITVSSQ